jgi:autotransporter-associated beta strand protein
VIGDAGAGYGISTAGAGTLVLGAANTYGGATVINGGMVMTTVNGALPPTTAVNFTAATNATLNLASTAQTVANLIVTNNAVVTNLITITGTNGSSLTVSPATLTLAPFFTTNSLTVNMSGLSAFSYSNRSGTVTVNNGVNEVAVTTSQTTVTLAGGANSITATTLNVGNSGTSGGVINSTLNLGTSNTLDVGTINLGASRSDGTIQFASGLINPVLTIAGVSGGGSTAAIAFGDHDSYTVSDHPVDLLDTSAGTLNAQLGSVTIGQSGPDGNTTGRGITITSSFKMGAGTLSASSMTVGNINSAANTTNYTINLTALFSITNGGTANITNLTVANNNLVGLSNTLTLSGTVSLNNGATLNAGNIQEGTVTAPATGTLTPASVLQWNDGTLGNIPGGNLLVNGVAVGLGGAANNHKVNISSGHTGQINAWISGTGTLTDVGAGALKLTGQNSFNGSLVMASPSTLTLTSTNTYTGSTTVSNGTLLVDGTIGTGTVTVEAGAVLGGSGTINGPTTVMAGGTVQGGDANYTNTLTVANTLTLGNSSSAATYGNFTIATGGEISAATLAVTGTNFVNILDASLVIGTNTLITYGGGSIGGSGFAGFQLGTLPAGVTARLLNTGNAAVQLAVTSITTVNTNSPVLTNSVSGGTLTLAWPADHLGWRLEAQTNPLTTGLGANWFTWPGSTNVTTESITINPANPTTFFRLIYP